MAFSIRREQGLLLGVVLIGVWIWSDLGRPYTAPRVTPKAKAYEPTPPPLVVLAAASEYRSSGRDGYVEPSETAPLPPRVIELPPLEPLPVVLPPLRPGVHPTAYHLQRVPGGRIEEFRFPDESAGAAGGASNGQANGPTPGVVAGATPAAGSTPTAGNGAAANPQGSGEADKTYDRLITQSGTYYGFLKNQNRLQLHGKTGPFLEALVFDHYDPRTGRLSRSETFEARSTEITRILLADNLRNQIDLAKRDLGESVDSLIGRAALLERVLAGGRETSWLYAEAKQQALDYLRIAANKLDGYLWLARVYREQGDLAEELAFYQGLPQEMRDTAFQLRGLGRVKALLRLDEDAEADFRRAVAAASSNEPDPRSQEALAAFLASRNRIAEALPHAEAARRSVMVVPSEAERFAILETLLGIQLALGDIAAARQTHGEMPSSGSFNSAHQFLRGAIAYAAGDHAAARPALEAGLAARQDEAALGLAVLQILDKEWVAARTALLSLIDQSPLLRGRALAALGLLHERIGNPAEGVARLEQALVVEPRDPYVLYTLGRLRREAGNAAGAIEALEGALRIDDEVAEAMAEVVLTRLRMADDSGEQGAEHVLAAVRYVDRLVDVDQVRGKSPRYLELQGLAHMRALDYRGARRAFQAGADQSLYCQTGLALVDYAQNRSDDARGRFADLTKQLELGHPIRVFAEETLKLIEDHAKKVQIRDGFERAELGNLWNVQRLEGIEQRVVADPDGKNRRLVVRGQLPSRPDPFRATRSIDKGGAFLAAEMDLKLGNAQDGVFAGLVLERAPTGTTGRVEFQVKFGYDSGKPYLLIQDGTMQARNEADRARFEPVRLAPTIDPTKPHRFGLAVAAKSDGNRRLVLQASIDGIVVHEREIGQLTPTTSNPVLVGLLVEGRPGKQVEVTCDDFRLVRRMEGT